MPGRVINDHDPINVTGKMNDEPTRPHALDQTQPLPNGVSSKPPENSQPAINGDGALPQPAAPAALPSDLKSAIQQMPPEPPSLVHVTDGYQPLSRLFGRAAQDCYNSLRETIAGTQDAPRPRMVNGNTNGVEHEGDHGAKRLRWLQFANSNRERFIKLLVLLQWSKQARDDIGQLVNVVSWMRSLAESYDDLEDNVGLYRREMAAIKIPSPDIDTALEILTTGQSSQMPDLDYLPRPPLPARQVLDTLQNIDTLLHIRLNVYEDLPRQLRNFKIASGRVTFIVPDEFELDLSIYDEDPSTHFYFLDFRFLFSPAPEIPVGPLRDELERRATAILASEGLACCYDFFHDFVLTHKLSILRRQVIDLARGAWTGTLRVERVHRSLVIQYWLGTCQKKNWVEIGVKSGRRREGPHSWQGDHPSQLFVKWVRAGREVSGETIRLNEQNLDVELLLDDVIRRHIRRLIGSARDKLMNALSLDLLSHTKFSPLDEEDDDVGPSLGVPLYFNGTSVLRIEPISGRFSLSPKTSSSTRCENSLNKLENPEEELFAKLQAWRAYDGSATFRENVARFGWEVLPPIQLESSARKQYFGDSVGQSFIKSWSDSKWVIAATPNPVLSFSLWILNVEESNQNLWRVDGYRVRNAFKVDSNTRNLSADYFAQLYQLSIATISSHITRNRLSELGIPFTFVKSEGLVNYLPFPVLVLDVSSITMSSAVSDRLLISHYGGEPEEMPSSSSQNIVHLARGSMEGTQTSKSSLTAIKSRDVGFMSDGAFAILDRSPAFTPQVVDNILRTVRHVVQLQSCLENLRRHHFRIMSVTLNALAFEYPYNSRILQARLSWSDSGSATIALAPLDNPHKRILPALRHLLHTPPTSSASTSATASVFTSLARTLLVTLNLLSGLDVIECQGGAIAQVERPNKYKIIYDLPKCVINISLRDDQVRNWWYIEQAAYSPRTNTKLQVELKSLMSESGEGIMGLNKGVAVGPLIVDKFLAKLDRLIRACADGEERRAKPKKEDKPENPQEAQAQAPVPVSAKKEKAQGKSQPKKQQAQAKQTGNGTGNGAKGNRPEVVVLD